MVMLTQESSSLVSVSVIIPVYNGALYLGEAIESVINQTRQPTEILVIDDGSTDQTAEVARRYAVKYHFRPHRGASAARNFGVARSSGQLLAFLDADDLWPPYKLATQMEILQDKAQIEAVFGQVEQFGSIERDDYRVNARFVGDVLNAPHVGTLLIRRDAFLRVGWFEERLSVAQFIDWYCRAEEAKLSIHVCEEVLLYRRVHGMNLTLQEKERGKKEYLQVIRDKLERQKLRKENH